MTSFLKIMVPIIYKSILFKVLVFLAELKKFCPGSFPLRKYRKLYRNHLKNIMKAVVWKDIHNSGGEKMDLQFCVPTRIGPQQIPTHILINNSKPFFSSLTLLF